MAIYFHEGFPRSGKSYETVVYWIIPQLREGRKVFAYIDGLNHEKIAELVGAPLPMIQKNLIQIEKEQVKEIYKYVEKDSLVVIDELQNFFAAGRQRLDEEMQRFITEHGHDGHDIVCMGQSLLDCHNMWRRRITQKTVFLKRDGVGRENTYKWTVYKGIPGEKDVKWQKVSSGVKEYDEKYFGSYASHTEGTTNKGNMTDERANIFNTTLFRRVLPLSGLAFVAAIAYLVSFFTVEDEAAAQTTQPELINTDPATNIHAARRLQQMPPPPPEPPKEYDYIVDLMKSNRIRLSGLLSYEEEGQERYHARVEIIDSTFHQKEVFTLQDIESLGWTVRFETFGLVITKEGQDDIIIRPWPIDQQGKVSNHHARNPALSDARPL